MTKLWIRWWGILWGSARILDYWFHYGEILLNGIIVIRRLMKSWWIKSLNVGQARILKILAILCTAILSPHTSKQKYLNSPTKFGIGHYNIYTQPVSIFLSSPFSSITSSKFQRSLIYQYLQIYFNFWRGSTLELWKEILILDH